MYHIVYLTTNLVNNKIYVGVHSTYDLEDGYLGRGKALKQALKKYGRNNFKRVILYFTLERIHALELEHNIVNEDFITRDDTYNLIIGGYGCGHMVNTNIGRKCSEETKKKISLANSGKNNGMYGVKYDKTKKKNMGIKISDALLNSDVFKKSRTSQKYREKISDIQSKDKAVYVIDKNTGELLKEFKNLREVADYFGYGYSNIKNARRFGRPIGRNKLEREFIIVYKKDYKL